TVVTENAFPCNCGKSGCLETVASATGIVRVAMQKIQETDKESLLRSMLAEEGRITSKDVFEAHGQGDELYMKNGMKGFGIKDVVNHAGVATGLFYYYFKSKENFVDEVLNDFIVKNMELIVE
ncbi:ROK family protein, partial [Bacillus sp. D-CC]